MVAIKVLASRRWNSRSRKKLRWRSACVRLLVTSRGVIRRILVSSIMPRFLKNLIGRVFGRWTVLSLDASYAKRSKWMCRCSCGSIRSVFANALLVGDSTKCSKCAGLSRRLDLTGRVFGDWTVLHADPANAKHWICQCRCSAVAPMFGASLRAGSSKCRRCYILGLRRQHHPNWVDMFDPEIFDGLMLSDGSLSRVRDSKNFQYSQQCRESSFLTWAAASLPTPANINGPHQRMDRRTRKNYFIYNLASAYDPFYTEQDMRWYRVVGQRRLKIVPVDLKLSPKTLLAMYIGDGHLMRRSSGVIRGIQLSTDGFERPDVLRLISQLDSMGFGVKLRISKKKSSKKIAYRIVLRARDVPGFLDHIGLLPSVLSFYAYKWDLSRMPCRVKSISLNQKEQREIMLMREDGYTSMGQLCFDFHGIVPCVRLRRGAGTALAVNAPQQCLSLPPTHSLSARCRSMPKTLEGAALFSTAQNPLVSQKVRLRVSILANLLYLSSRFYLASKLPNPLENSAPSHSDITIFSQIEYRNIEHLCKT